MDVFMPLISGLVFVAQGYDAEVYAAEWEPASTFGLSSETRGLNLRLSLEERRGRRRPRTRLKHQMAAQMVSSLFSQSPNGSSDGKFIV